MSSTGNSTNLTEDQKQAQHLPIGSNSGSTQGQSGASTTNDASKESPATGEGLPQTDEP
ncbi:hypothetical protein BGZ79_007827, partial [Entomortierella chlamydospora]